MHHADLVLAELADRQYGVVGRRQALHLGISAGEIEARLRSGALFPVRRGVYAVGRPRLPAAGWRTAGVLAAGAGARLIGWTGATHSALLPDAGRRIDVGIPPGRRVSLPGVAVRRVRTDAGDVVLVDGIPTHSVPRLLLDLAAWHAPDIAEWAWRQAIHARVLEVRAVQDLVDRSPRARGTPVLRDLLARRAHLVGEVRNAFELAMLGIVRDAGLPEPLVNAPLDIGNGVTLHPDFRIPQLLLIIESDGRDGHADVEFLQSDAERDAAYAALGYRTLRYGWFEATRERGRLLAELREHAQRPRRVEERGARGGTILHP